MSKTDTDPEKFLAEILALAKITWPNEPVAITLTVGGDTYSDDYDPNRTDPAE